MTESERKYARPTIDLMFKKVFGTSTNTDCLISFLSSLLNISIKSLEIENPEPIKLDYASKGIRLDILATLQSEHKVNIEMQVANEGDIDKRALYYWSKIYHSQMQSGSDYSHLKPVYGVYILDFEWFPEDMPYLNKFVLKEKQSNKHFFHCSKLIPIETERHEMLEICFLELPKFKETGSLPTTNLERWVTFLSTKNDKLLEDLRVMEPTFEKAVSELEIARMTPIQKREYYGRMEALSDYLTSIRFNRQQGMAEGLAEGEARGEARGEAKTAKAIAIKLKNNGVSYELISETTGLSIAEIEQL